MRFYHPKDLFLKIPAQKGNSLHLALHLSYPNPRISRQINQLRKVVQGLLATSTKAPSSTLLKRGFFFLRASCLHERTKKEKNPEKPTALRGFRCRLPPTLRSPRTQRGRGNLLAFLLYKMVCLGFSPHRRSPRTQRGRGNLLA